MNDNEETEEIKIFPPLLLPAARTAGLAQLQANISWMPRWCKIHDAFASPNHPTDSIFTLSIGTLPFLTMLVLKFGKVNFLTCWIFQNITGWEANSVDPDAAFCGIWSGPRYCSFRNCTLDYYPQEILYLTEKTHCTLWFFKITWKSCGKIGICLLRVYFKKISTKNWFDHVYVIFFFWFSL